MCWEDNFNYSIQLYSAAVNLHLTTSLAFAQRTAHLGAAALKLAPRFSISRHLC